MTKRKWRYLLFALVLVGVVTTTYFGRRYIAFLTQTRTIAMEERLQGAGLNGPGPTWFVDADRTHYFLGVSLIVTLILLVTVTVLHFSWGVRGKND